MKMITMIRSSVLLPQALHDRLKAVSIANRRSMVQQVALYIELGVSLDEGALSNEELIALNDPAVRAAVSVAKSGRREQLAAKPGE